MSPPLLQPLAGAPLESVDALLDRVFGTDRHGRTAYAVRAGTSPLDELCFGAWGAGGNSCEMCRFTD